MGTSAIAIAEYVKKQEDKKEKKKESILVMLGITGTVFKLLVIVFMYIYTIF